uniref:FBA_2 domain-containing protein n=1 Tax=Steinernema glaseri TaxID=37863 RepID=A0A1I7Z1M4_9BILA
MFRTTDTPLLPRTITYEILKNANSNFESTMQVSEEWKYLMESILDVKYNLYLTMEEQEQWAYYYSGNPALEGHQYKEIGTLAQLDDQQCERLGELRIVGLAIPNGIYAVDFREDSPTIRFQFKKLDVVSHHGDLDMLPKIVQTDFKEISMSYSSASKCFPLPATLKKLHLNDFCFREEDSQQEFLSFVQNMTWEEISVLNLWGEKLLKGNTTSLERVVIEAWREAEDPQLNLFQSDVLQEEEWRTFFEEIQHRGRMIDQNTLHIDHKRLKKTLCITVEHFYSNVLEPERRVHMRCL